MGFFDRIVESRIRDAIDEGLFEGLSTEGKPLQIEDLSRMPAELRGAYSMLKHANILPEEMMLKKELVNLGDLLRACRDEGEQELLRERMNNTALRYAILMERRKLRREL